MIQATVPVVVVTHAGPNERLRRCLASLAVDGQADPVIVVDNSGAPEAEANAYGPGRVEVVRTPNRGYGAAANVGFETARRLVAEASTVALLNDDIEVDAGWLAPLGGSIVRGVDVAQPKLLQAPRSPDPVVNSLGVQLDKAGAGTDVGNGQSDGPNFERGRDIELFTGGAVLFSCDFLDVTGGFDERYFMYYEDVDLSRRGGEFGFRYRCEPASTVWHEGGATTSRLGNETRRLQERNRLWCAVRFLPPRRVCSAFWLSIRRLRHEPRRVHARALGAGIRGVPIMLRERRAAHRQSTGAVS